MTGERNIVILAVSDDPADGSEAVDAGGPFKVGDKLTIYEAAMVYCGRHPGGRFLNSEKYGRASLREHDIFLGKGSHDPTRALSWYVYGELRRRVAEGSIKPVSPAYMESGEFNPLDTVVNTADVAALARERGETPEYLAAWMREPQRTSKRSRRAVDQAINRLKEKYLDGVPARTEKSDRQIHDALKRPNEPKAPFSLDSTRRALREIAPNRSR